MSVLVNKSVRQFREPIARELKIFEQRFRDDMRSSVRLLDRITRYIYRRKGKQVRPMFVLLCAKLVGNRVTDATYTAASLIELLHTASLVHDDVVDDAQTRRGFFSINAIWKNKISVLVGDYLLSRGLLLALEKGEHKVLEITSRAVREMSEGELLQIEKARRLDIDEAVYFEVIRQKTASLIAAACSAGAASIYDDAELIERVRLFGEKIGIAFQIRDDLFDYGDQDVGKPLGIDIKEKKMTLPLIYALRTTDNRTRKHIIRTIKRHHDKPERVREVIEFVRNSGGLTYAREQMRRFRDEAFQILYEFPENDARTALENLVNYVVERKK